MFKKMSYYLPTLGQSWLIFVFLVFVGGIASQLICLPFIYLLPKEGVMSEIVSKVFGYILMFIPPLIFVWMRSKFVRMGMEESGIKTEPIKFNDPNFGKITPVLFFILISFALVALNLIIDPISSLMKTPEWFEKVMSNLIGGNKIVTLLSVSILAPLLEEFLCRGVILRGLLQRISPAKAIMWSALIFAVLHLNPWQAVPAFLLGVFFGWIYYKTGSLWATIFLHFLNNTVSSILAFAFPELPMSSSLRELLPNAQSYWLLVAVGVGVFTLVFFLINKYIPNKNGRSKETPISAEI